MWCRNRLLWHTNSGFYGIRTPTFMPDEPFLLGVGVVFNILRNSFEFGLRGVIGKMLQHRKTAPKSHLSPNTAAHVCGDPLSRYTCRGRFPQNPGASGVAVVSRYTVPKRLCRACPSNCQGCRTPSCLRKGVALQGGVAATLAGVALHCATTLLLLNGLNKDKEVIAPLFKVRRLGLRPLETTCFLGQNSLIALPSASLNKEDVTSLSYLSRLAATGYEPTLRGEIAIIVG